MVTTVTGTREKVSTAQPKIGAGVSRPRSGGGGGGSNGSRGSDGGGAGGDGARRWSPDRYRLGMMAGIASILMMFTALASAYIARAGLATSTDWRPIELPRVVWLSTLLIVLSSVTISLAQKALRRGAQSSYGRWLAATFVLGLGFLAAQLVAWRQLAAQGIYLKGNPHSSFFYVLTGLHGLHLAGGILGLGYLLLRARRAGERIGASAKVGSLTDVMAIYWHFMDGLWVFLFLLLFLWR
ncbi:MAG TPA: cytochrome c oxidase subunit 3 [Pyrinomonadaceae bacterium]|nr:cytochrome c oxidase subunit 3 [Pyrinomonadaceae bacterium]